MRIELHKLEIVEGVRFTIRKERDGDILRLARQQTVTKWYEGY